MERDLVAFVSVVHRDRTNLNQGNDDVDDDDDDDDDDNDVDDPD